MLEEACSQQTSLLRQVEAPSVTVVPRLFAAEPSSPGGVCEKGGERLDSEKAICAASKHVERVNCFRGKLYNISDEVDNWQEAEPFRPILSLPLYLEPYSAFL